MRRAVSFAVLLGLACPLASARAADPPAPGDVRDAIPTLEERLTTGLRVQAPADTAFCERVATLVQRGELPAKVVDSTYLWAVRRGKEYPFPAFRYAIRIKAARLGVKL